jgi:hypothetical protein
MADYSFDGGFYGPTQLVSTPVAYGNGPVSSAKLIINAAALLPDSSYFNVYFSNDGGTTWELGSFNTTHSFTSNGSSLCYRIIGESGGSIVVRQNDGSDYPIIVQYNL